MASIFKLLSLTLFLSLVFKAEAGCSPFEPQDLSIVQSKTGKLEKGKAVWKVTITNSCRCAQSQVKLSCNGFRTVKAIDPSILTISGSACLLKNGHTISPSQTVQFLYAWNPQYPFVLGSYQVHC